MSQPPLVAFPKQPSEPTEPRSLDHNMPILSTPLIGRERELETACELLRRPNVRLLTLTGPPGIGKTRLALEIVSNLARDFLDGTYFVPLAPITEPGLVLPTIAQTVEVKEATGQPLAESLANYLRNRQVLLVLDNFEQAIGAGTAIAELLAHCPGLKALVTSREVLHIYGEYDHPVPPLSLPDPNKLPDLEALSHYEAVELFLHRAQAVSPGFQLTERNAPAVAEICLRLDGLPLAIELAAARILVLPPEELLARLESRLKLLTGGARNLPARQRTLEASIDWSYNLLDPGEQALFRRLGVFVGGCTFKAIEEVYGSIDPEEPGIDILDGVTSLISKSLLQRQEGATRDGEPRFMMLETIREYARGKLEEGGEFDLISDHHFDYFLQFAENAEQGTLGSETALWMRRLDAEQNNLRAALEWSLSPDGRAEKGLRLAGALMRYWDDRGYFSEGQHWCTQLLSKTDPCGPSVERAKALRALARMTWQQGDFTEARSIYEQSLEMSRALGDERGVASALIGLGSVVRWQGEDDFSRSLVEESLAIGRRLGDRHLIATALSLIGVILMRKEEYRAAQSPLDESLVIDRELGNRAGLAARLTMRGSVAIHLGEYDKAKELIEESLGIAREIEAKWIIVFCLARLGLIALRQGDPHQAEAFLMEGLGLAQDSGIRRWSRWYLVGLAEVARLRGMVERAAKLTGASESVATAAGAYYEPATSYEIERIMANVRAELDEESFARRWAEGRAMSLEEVVAYAEESGPPTPATSTITPIAAIRGQQAYPSDLTEREVEVLRLIAVGKSNQEIAQELVLSLRTVERHISNIYQKIGATGRAYARATATAYALKHGMTQ